MSAKKLMIIESGGKVDTIKDALKLIDKDQVWDIEASSGHIQSLNSDKTGVYGSLGIDKQSLKMDYKLSSKGVSVVKKLKDMIKKNNYSQIVLAMDADREGEAIAEHLRQRLKLGEDDYDRCVFVDLSVEGIKEGFKNIRKVDKNLTKAQDARRILDRVVGWEGTTAASAAASVKMPIGRCISQAVKMIVMRDRERRDFVQKEHYGIGIQVDGWRAELDLKQSKLIGGETDTEYWQDRVLIDKLVSRLKGETIAVIDSTEEIRERFAPPPFETSTMHQAAFKKLGWKSKKTDAIAQKLYQGGHITYIRTDSTAMSDTAFEQLTKYGKSSGFNILGKKREGKKGKVDQEAHECIRPSSFGFGGEGLEKDELALYDLIKTRTIASQLAPAKFKVITATLATDDDYIFKASSSVMTDKGWKALTEKDESGDEEEQDEAENVAANPLPKLDVGAECTISETYMITKKTKPPPPMDEDILGRMMKKEGVGRPGTLTSTYMSIGLGGHGYINDKGAHYIPMELAEKMVDVTNDHLCIMDTAFSVSMEDHLNDIANGKIENDTYMLSFFERFESNIANMLKQHVAPPAECLDCGEKSLARIPRKEGNAYFWGCRNTECGATFSDDDGKPVDFEKEFMKEDGSPKFPCPKCEKALIRITAKKDKRQWWICSDKEKDKDKKCPYIVANGDDGCPDFKAKDDYEEWKQKVKDAHNDDGTPIHPCPDCGKALVKNISKSDKEYYKCSAKKADCDYFTMADDNGDPKEK